MPQLTEQYQSLSSVVAGSSRSIASSRVLLVDDTLGGEGSIGQPVTLANHYAAYGNPDDGSAPWVRHPNSPSTADLVVDHLTNGSGSTYSLYSFRRDPGTVDYRVEIDTLISSLAVGGNATYACARMDATQETFYYGFFLFNSTVSFKIGLGKCVGGTLTSLVPNLELFGADMPVVGENWKIALSVSNDEKVVYLKKPTDAFYRRVLSSGDNSITAAGFGGMRMLRSNNTTGASPTAWRLYYNGPQAPGSGGATGTPDPVQTPQLLWQPDYSAASQSVAGIGGIHVNSEPAPWKSEQEPFVRGVRQLDRMQIVAAVDVPGSGPNKPTGGAMRIELRKEHDNDITVTATASALSTALTLQMSAPDTAALFDRDFMLNERTHEILRVDGVPSGTTVTVKRAQSTVAAAILSGDTFVVYCGDVSDSGNAYVTNRAEAYDRFAETGSTAPELWPDPVGSIRWYRVLVYSDPSNEDASWGGKWTTLDQWKGQFGGSPPRALEVSSSGVNYELAGTRTRLSLGAISHGSWVKFVFGIRWDTSAINGWVTAYRDDVLIIPKRYEATMDFKYNKPANGADPTYYKQGIYRTSAWEDTLIFYYGETKIGTTYADVA